MGIAKTLLIAVVVLVAAGAAYWGYGEQQKRVQREAVLKVVADTTAQLREALAKAPSAELVAKLEANLQAVQSPRNRELQDGAEHYIVGAREIARRRADAGRLAAEAAASRQALAAHMAHRSRGADWYKGAVALKNKAEQNHADLGRTLKALDELLEGMLDAQKRLAPHVPAGLLLEAAARDAARKQAREDAQRAAAELEKARQLAPR